jgi:polyhydroxyalkanoate synthase
LQVISVIFYKIAIPCISLAFLRRLGHIHDCKKDPAFIMTVKKLENPASRPENDEVKLPDPVALTHALIGVYERAQPMFEELMKRSGEDIANINFDPLHVNQLYMEFWENVAANPQKFWELQTEYWQSWMQLCQETAMRMMGEKSAAVIQPDKSDRRFKAQEWQENAVFDFIKQSYLLMCDAMDKTVRGSVDIDEKKKEKLAFTTRLFADALSPTNFFMTNPDVIKETLRTGGDNLVRGLENLIEDIKRGHGELKISTTDYDAFELGRNIATTEGAVVYENELIQLIQYKPLTKNVHERPLLIIPPWINKYYILDLRPDNSFIKHAVEQGYTVFAVSWVNPDSTLAKKRFEEYMNEGVLDALDAIKKITGVKDCNVIGYCLGGTLLTITLAYLKAIDEEDRVASATFLTTLMDFEHAGDLKLFMDDGQLEMMDREMAEKGFLEAKQLQKTFSLLRSNDLIWSFVVNNYLMGKEPFPFDLLYWNDDSTNMPAAMHSFYLRKMYRDNLLIVPGGIQMDREPINISRIDTPAYFLSTREDHIAPWRATYQGTQYLSGPKIFTLAASGHIAGVVNPPAKKKYCYWTYDETPGNPDQWLDNAKEHAGSWWPHWLKWMGQYKGKSVPARAIKKAIEPAPGSYVKVRSD